MGLDAGALRGGEGLDRVLHGSQEGSVRPGEAPTHPIAAGGSPRSRGL
jgi:hypothetical protein